ncbi:hypothetical protein G6L37_11630 [Agrobacterium rubi]|uniref:hypothetical protein n=1 Tax=Agrobacterium rubi TaxID=28099 RepID=UPI001571ADB6|nr:hypothetical protein [Agrobacterium rubi]NTF06812.1 hypothetical protein [Agrobacterium rubi]NTF19054.1 hypothetical protein [Agrobacterium rubi]NTF26017.1 hypothetical protein [Agrobacterium rubi]
MSEPDTKRPTRLARYGAALMFVVVMILLLCAMLLGAQLAFLVQLPRLSELLRDGHSMWLVFSTWPDTRFGLFFAMAYFVNIEVSKLSDFQSFRNWIGQLDRRHVVAVIGTSIFLMPLLLGTGMPLLLSIAAIILCCIVGGVVLRLALKAGVPTIIVVVASAVAIGFFGNLLMSKSGDDTFVCRKGSVELRSGQTVACDKIVSFSDKSLWLIESASQVRLVAWPNLEFKNVLDASRPKGVDSDAR